jgi:peptidoglycan/LPS O-acetylase OafA/YrhL
MKQEKEILLQDQPAPAGGHPAYRRDIDGLRAIAVLSVVLFHAFPTWLHGGFIGVDIFFVISGFLITGILVRELGQGSFSFAHFYARRIRRIFPALVLVLGASLAFGWFALFPDEYQQLGKHTVGGAGFAANFFYWAQVGYFDTAAETKPLLHLWSLGIEEQFYIVWPVVLLLAWKLRLNLLATAALLGLASFGLNVATVAHNGTAAFYNPASRAWELLIGAGLACMHARAAQAPARASKISPNLLAWAGVALLVAGLVLITRQRHFPGGWPLLPTLGAAFLIAAGPQAWFNRVVLSNRPMVWVGLISYPLYLWHWPLLSFAQIVESGVPAPAIRGAAVGAAIVLAWLTYLLVERPLRGGAAARWKVPALCVLMLAVASAGAYIYEKEGLPTRKAVEDSVANQKALIVVEDKANAAACKKRYGFEGQYQYCLQADATREPTVVLVGDSHAYHVSAGLLKYYSSIGENLLMLGTRFPYWGLNPEESPYQRATDPMLDLALSMPSVKTVVFTTYLRFHTEPEVRHYVDAARTTFRRFLGAGKNIIFMNDVPALRFDPRSCIKRAGVASSATRVPCAIPLGAWEEQITKHNIIVEELKKEFPQIQWFDAAPAFCDDRECRAMIDGRLMYRDDNHLSYDGDLRVGERFGEWHRTHVKR